MTREEAAKKVLINKEINLEFIPEKYNETFIKIDKDHIGKSVYTGCNVGWELPLSNQHNGYLRILDGEEQEAFEVLLERPIGSLSFFKFGQPDNFWMSTLAKVSIDRDGTRFDLKDPIQNLKWRVTKVQSFVAPSWDERLDDIEYKWALKDVGQQTKANADMAKLKRTAIIKLASMSRAKQINVLTALGLRVPSDIAEEYLLNKFDEITNTVTSIVHLPSVKDLVRVIEDEEVDEKAFMEECIRYKVFSSKPPGKYTYDGEVIIASGGKQSLLQFIKNPENSVFIEGVKERLKSLKDD